MKIVRRNIGQDSCDRLQPGRRIYAIGDVHGRLDLLESLICAIDEDNKSRQSAAVTIVILGDFIDRGEESAQVVHVLMRLWRRQIVVLAGNHERSLTDGLTGDRSAVELWLEHGGEATLRSFGATDHDIYPNDDRNLLANIRRIIPRSVASWLKKLPVAYRAGGYLFVHAGIRPGIALNRQSVDDMLWIRDDFIESDADHGAIIVHGHTVTERVCFRANRIGVDTGAYRTGRLSAVGLEANNQWLIEAVID